MEDRLQDGRVIRTLIAGTHFPSPLVGEGGTDARSAFVTGEGLSPRTPNALIETPHPALRATFSHKGEKEESYAAAAAVTTCASSASRFDCER
jgi:hypothetical protein